MYSICFIFSYLSNILMALAKQISGMLAPIYNGLFGFINQLKRHKTCPIVDAQTLNAAEYDRLYSRFYPKPDKRRLAYNSNILSQISVKKGGDEYRHFSTDAINFFYISDWRRYSADNHISTSSTPSSHPCTRHIEPDYGTSS